MRRKVPSFTIKCFLDVFVNRGEGTKGYSLQFRHLEFTNAYNATLTQKMARGDVHDMFNSYTFRFNDASPTVDELDDSYGAMQYIDMFQEKHYERSGENDILQGTGTTTSSVLQPIDKNNLIEAAERCSLVRNVYEIVGVGDTYEGLAHSVLKHQKLIDMTRSSNATKQSWSLRLREYGSESDKNRRYGTRKRSSMSKERDALQSMSSILLNKFVGPVNLKSPDCPLHVLEGLNFDLVEDESFGSDSKNKARCNVMVRGIATGMKTSIISPNSRICITRVS